MFGVCLTLIHESDGLRRNSRLAFKMAHGYGKRSWSPDELIDTISLDPEVPYSSPDGLYQDPYRTPSFADSLLYRLLRENRRIAGNEAEYGTLVKASESEYDIPTERPSSLY